MCAIHGILDKRPLDIVKMIEAAHHRGPDGNGKWNDDDITLGHNLLSITDIVSNSNQPWFHNNLVLVYNGEIYNYKELGKEFDLKTNNDTEVLIKGIEKYGVDFLYKIDGMFAFACYNKKTKDLIIARDSNGSKPFYYTNFNNTFAFSSEIKSLLSLGVPRKVNLEAFSHYYNSGLVAGYLTMFKQINKLIPGEIKIINLKTKSENKFNINNKHIEQLKFDSKFSRDNILSLIPEKLNEAVKMTQMGRREIGLFLSGGMDSSSILYELKSLGIKSNCFSTSFLNESNVYNEDSILAKKLAELYESNFKDVVTTSDSWIDNFEKAIYCLEEPRQGKSYSSYFQTNKFLSDNGITVTLTGDGGDELLAGYKHHRRPNWKNKFTSLRGNHKELKNSQLQLTVEQQVDYLNSWIPKGGLQGDELNDFLYIESLHTLSEDFLIRNDKLGMNFSMETRFPMMCNVFRDFIRSIPGKEKLKSKFTEISVANKPLLREAYVNKLPDFIINKSKSGWRSPTDDWIIGDSKKPASNDNPVRHYLRSLIEDNKEAQELFEINMKDVDERYLNNYDWRGINKIGGPGIGVLSQKQLFIVATYCVWAKQYNMII